MVFLLLIYLYIFVIAYYTFWNIPSVILKMVVCSYCTYIPVSYTHLDVYKRQGCDGALSIKSRARGGSPFSSLNLVTKGTNFFQTTP